MTFTYDATLTTNRDTVRMLVNDTVEASARFTDEQIAFFLARAGDEVYEAGALALEQLASRYALVPNVSLNGKSMSGAALHGMLLKQAETLRTSGAATGGIDLSGYGAGLSWEEALTDAEDDDIPAPPLGIVGALPGVRPSRDYREQERDW